MAGIAIQLIPIFPMAVKPTSLPNTLIAVRGWPYVAQVYTETTPPPIFPPDENYLSYKHLAINAAVTATLVVICLFGLFCFVFPRAPAFTLLDSLSAVTGVAGATAYLCGNSPAFLKTGVNLYYSVLEITITDRPLSQRATLAFLVSLAIYTAILAGNRLLKAIRRSKPNAV